MSRWVNSIENTIEGGGPNLWLKCCSLADCRPTEVRVRGDGETEAWIGREAYGAGAPDAWMLVDEHAKGARSAGPAPDGHSWVCFYGGRVRCYVPAWGG